MKASEVGRRLASLVVFVVTGAAHGQQSGTLETSYLPVAVKDSPATIQKRMEAAKPELMRRQLHLLRHPYHLDDRRATGVTMSRGKPVQEGVRARLAAGTTWET